MLENIATTLKRLAQAPLAALSGDQPLVRVGSASDNAVAVAQTDIASLRGVTRAAADTRACTCPDACERDHANE